MTDTDLEYADRAVAQMQRSLEAARADLAALTKLVSDVEAALYDAVDSGICAPPIDDWREWAEILLVKVRKREYIPSLALTDMRADVARLVREVQEMAARVDEMRAERDDARANVESYRLTVANMMRMLGQSPNADLRIAELAVGAEVREVDKLRERLRDIAQTIIERIGTPGPESAEETVARLLGALDRAEAERDAAKAARALPGGRDPDAKLPVVPSSCKVCNHSSLYDGKHLWCDSDGRPEGSRVVRAGEPDDRCPIRAELAKVTP
jgi:uncharacterized coiled-coil protein SlyX